MTVCIVFKMTNMASGDQIFVNSLIGNCDQRVNSKFITFYRTPSSLGLLISKAQSLMSSMAWVKSCYFEN